MKILVTGSDGLLGQHLQDEAIEDMKEKLHWTK